MHKDSEDKLTNAIIALHQEIKRQGENTRKELAKINLGLGELRVSVVNLDSRLKKQMIGLMNILEITKKY